MAKSGRICAQPVIMRVVEAFPDFHWDLRHLLVDDCWLSAHLVEAAAYGRSVGVPEYQLDWEDYPN